MRVEKAVESKKQKAEECEKDMKQGRVQGIQK